MKQTYSAPKPTFSSWEKAKFIFIRMIIPPILLWDLIKFGANRLFGAWVSDIVLPGQNESFDDVKKITDDDVKNHNTERLECEKYEITTYDGAKLDTFEVKNNSQKNIDPKYQKYIINLVGNCMCY